MPRSIEGKSGTAANSGPNSDADSDASSEAGSAAVARWSRSDATPRRRAMNLVTLAWIFGSVWMTATSGAPLTQFARSLGASNFQFGLLAALPFIASLLSLPGAVAIDRTGKRKTIFLWFLYAQRLLWIPIALVPIWMLHARGPGAAPAALVVSLWLIC